MTKLSISLMLTSARTRPDEMADYARHAESLGFDALFVGDHLATVAPTLESTLMLATVAAVTERLRVGFGVMILALRQPAWVAKQIATLQQLSGSRVILGVGTGGDVHGTAAWEALGIPWAERGRMTDAALDILPGLLAGVPTEVAPGKPLTLAPAAELPPIWIGGASRAAMRRAVQRGGAWFPSMLTPPQLVAAEAKLSELARQAGRLRPAIALGGSVLLDTGPTPSVPAEVMAGLVHYGLTLEDAATVPIVGTPAHAAEQFALYRDAGADHLVLGIVGDHWKRQCDLIAEARELLNRS